MTNPHLELILPPDFDEYAWEVEAKGHFAGARAAGPAGNFALTFYDALRLGQEVADEVAQHGYFLEPNVIVVHAVTREAMVNAVAALASFGGFERLVR